MCRRTTCFKNEARRQHAVNKVRHNYSSLNCVIKICPKRECRVAAWWTVIDALLWIRSSHTPMAWTDMWPESQEEGVGGGGCFQVTNSTCSSEVAIPPWTGDCQQKWTPESEEFDKILSREKSCSKSSGKLSILETCQSQKWSSGQVLEEFKDTATIFNLKVNLISSEKESSILEENYHL